MCTQPGAFTHWIAASPSITWEDQVLSRCRTAFDPAGRRLILHLSAGEWEGDLLAPFQGVPKDAATRLAGNLKSRTLDAMTEMAADLSRHPELTVHHEIYPNESHMSALPVAINRALHTVFPKV